MRFLIFVIVSHRTVRDGEPTPQVELWNLERPYLYTVQTALTTPSGMSDSINTTIGVRSALFSADSGFVLNGADKFPSCFLPMKTLTWLAQTGLGRTWENAINTKSVFHRDST
jgi:hypothetical protein